MAAGIPKPPHRHAYDATGATRVAQHPLGLKLIIIYKFVKAPLMLALALWLTAAPDAAHRSLESAARELAEGGAAWARVSAWVHAHLTSRSMLEGAVLAWLDTVSTVVEGGLLLSGRSWAEWLVIIGLASLLPIELLSLGHRPGTGKLIVLATNAVIVMYLVRRRVLGMRAHGPGPG